MSYSLNARPFPRQVSASSSSAAFPVGSSSVAKKKKVREHKRRSSNNGNGYGKYADKWVSERLIGECTDRNHWLS